ncbi:MAG TPA: SOS response-associated peptidase family protein, partial [Methylocystis sp.]|nr:SOS response-associated peptidase family protein [Methylocystis sp.]
MRWGKKPLGDFSPTLNARAETIPRTPTFRSAFKLRRCVLQASGFPCVEMENVLRAERDVAVK